MFLDKTIPTTYIDCLNEVKDELLPAIKPMTDDKDPELRDLSLKVLGILQGRLGKPALEKYIEGIIPQK